LGAITQAKQEIKQSQQQDNSFAGLIKRCAPQLQAVMPKGFTPERLTQLAIATYKQIPDLKECSVQSMLSCCLKCAEIGLEPNDIMGNAYILPYNNRHTGRKEAQFILGKNGMLELVRRSGQVKTVRTQCVYEGDDFDYWEDETGVHFSFKPNLDADHSAKKLKLVYLSCHLKDGGFVFLQMSKKEVDEVKDRSKASKFGPWASDYAAMAEKTVIRRAFNRGLLPRSVEVAKAVTDDDSTPIVLDEEGNRLFEDPLAPEPTDVPANVDAETGEIIEEVSE
jgi:recombination protein RecT